MGSQGKQSTGSAGGERVDVGLGVVVRGADAVLEVLLTRRPAGTVYAGYWELPGGKVHAGETPAGATERELREELGIAVRAHTALPIVEHVYDHAHVRLHAFYCEHVGGEPRNLQVAEHRWVPVDRLGEYPLPEANEPITRRIIADHL